MRDKTFSYGKNPTYLEGASGSTDQQRMYHRCGWPIKTLTLPNTSFERPGDKPFYIFLNWDGQGDVILECCPNCNGTLLQSDFKTLITEQKPKDAYAWN